MIAKEREQAIALGALCAVMVLSFSVIVGLAYKSLERKLETGIALSNGDATYLPGAACVIASSAEHTPADIINYARACAKSHEGWLEEQQ